MLKIALTGGIASGKTLACKTLKNLGAHIIDADIIAREIVQKGEEGATRIKQAFGDSFFEKGNLNRRKLSEYVFSKPNRVQLLNSLLHPLIRKRIDYLIQSCTSLKVVFVVVPILIESGMIDMFDRVWTIAAKTDIRIKRLIRRDNISIQQAYNILDNQVSEQEREKIADVVIHNNGKEDEFVKEIKTHYRNLIQELGLD